MASLKKCIAEMCKSCIYDPKTQGSWRSQVEHCTCTVCPLWPVRPVTTETLNARRAAGKNADVDENETEEV